MLVWNARIRLRLGAYPGVGRGPDVEEDAIDVAWACLHPAVRWTVSIVPVFHRRFVPIPTAVWKLVRITAIKRTSLVRPGAVGDGGIQVPLPAIRDDVPQDKLAGIAVDSELALRQARVKAAVTG